MHTTENGQSLPALQAAPAALPDPSRPSPVVVKRRRPLPRPGQREALRALDGSRALLLGALSVAALSAIFCVVSLAVSGGAPTVFLVVAAMVLPLGLGASYFAHSPVLVRRCLHTCGALLVSWAVFLWVNPMNQIYMAGLAGSMIAVWYLPASGSIIRRWIQAANAPLLLGCQFIDDNTYRLLSFTHFLVSAFLTERDATRDAIASYVDQGGTIEDLYDVVSEDEKSLISLRAVVIFILVVTFGMTALWSIGPAMNSGQGSPGVIGIGGGR